MKKFLYALALTVLVLSLAACACDHVDEDLDALCDKCGKGYSDTFVNVTFEVKVEGGEALSGVHFSLKQEGAVVESLTTGTDGKINLGIEVGEYAVEYDSETLPENHQGDVYIVEIKSDTREVTLGIVDHTPDGSAENPFFLSEDSNKVTIAAGAENYYKLHDKVEAKVVVKGENLVVKYDGDEYVTVDGVAEFELKASGNDVVISVKNNGSAAADVTIERIYPVGSRENPNILEAKTADITVASGKSVHYKWTADKTGVLIVKSSDKASANIGLTNLATNAVSAQTLGTNAGAYVTVKAGESILVAVSASVGVSSADITLTLEVYEGSAADPVPAINSSVEYTLAAGASITYKAEAGKKIEASNSNIVIKIGDRTVEPDEYGIFSETLDETGLFTVTNNSESSTKVKIDIAN